MPSDLLQITLVPTTTALSQHRWMRHSDGEITLLITACLMKIIRISAPQGPIEDNTLKEVIPLIVDIFQNLGNIQSHHFSRRTTILKIFLGHNEERTQ